MTSSVQPNSVDCSTTPGVEYSDNFKDYFLRNDSLENISRELVFTIFNRYMCKAGCKMCYLQDVWVPDDQFKMLYVPTHLSPQTESSILEFFDFFDTVSTIDDLAYIKKQHPQLYQFYVRNAQRMFSSQMSDTAFVQQYALMMEEVHFKGVYEISFSDTFLGKKNGAMVDDLIEQLTKLHVRSPIIKLKVIIQWPDGEKAVPVLKFIEFAHSLGLSVGVHDDFTVGENRRLTFDDDTASQELNYYAENSEPKSVLCEVVYLAHTSIVLTLNDLTESKGLMAYDIKINGVQDVDHIISAVLQAKLDTYVRYTKEISDVNSKHREYFKWVAEHVVINHDFNFIPKFVLKPWTKFYQKLKQQGWTETQYGLFDPTCAVESVIPAFSFRTTPFRTIPVRVTYEPNKI